MQIAQNVQPTCQKTDFWGWSSSKGEVEVAAVEIEADNYKSALDILILGI